VAELSAAPRAAATKIPRLEELSSKSVLGTRDSIASYKVFTFVCLLHYFSRT
jgi:hypothetical protein